MQTTYYVMLGTLLLGVILFFYLASRKKYRDASAAPNYDAKKNESIEHYKQVRDKLSLRKIKIQEEPTSSGSGILGNLVGGFVFIMVGLSILPTISDAVNSAYCSTTPSSINVTSAINNFACINKESAQGTMLGLVTPFFALIICIAALFMVGNPLRNSGLI